MLVMEPSLLVSFLCNTRLGVRTSVQWVKTSYNIYSYIAVSPECPALTPPRSPRRNSDTDMKGGVRQPHPPPPHFLAAKIIVPKFTLKRWKY